MDAQKVWCPAQAKKITGHWIQQIVLLLFALCIGLGLPQLPAAIAVSQGLSLIAIVAIQSWRRRAIRSQQFQNLKDQFEEVSVRIDDEGYHDDKSGTCGGWIAWKGFTGWRETDSIFILGRGLTFVTIPKRPFSMEQQASIREMFRSNVPAEN